MDLACCWKRRKRNSETNSETASGETKSYDMSDSSVLISRTPLLPTNKTQRAFQTLYTSYINMVTRETRTHHRLRRSREFVRLITGNISKSLQSSDIETIICLLLRTCLERGFTDRPLQDFLVGQETTTMIRNLVRVTRNTGAVIDGLIQAVSTKGIGIDRMVDFGGELLEHYFHVKDGKINVASGFVIKIFTFLGLCGDRQVEACGRVKYYPPVLDKSLAPLILAAVKHEKRGSINKTDNWALTPLHHSAYFCLPGVIKALLSHGDIDVNTCIRHPGRTPLMYLLDTEAWLGETHMETATVLLSHPDIDVSIVDKSGKTALHFCAEHLRSSDSNKEVVLQIMKSITNHPTCTSTMLQNGLLSLLSWKPPDTVAGKLTETLLSIISQRAFDTDCFLRLPRAAVSRNIRFFITMLDVPSATENVLHVLCDLCDCVSMNEVAYSQILRAVTEVRRSCASSLVLINYCDKVLESCISNRNETVNLVINDQGHTIAHACAIEVNVKILELIFNVASFDPNVRDSSGNTVSTYIDQYLPNSRFVTNKQTGTGAISRDIELNVLQTVPRNLVKASAEDFIRSQKDRLIKEEIYNMFGAKKGKVLLISVSEFTVPWLVPLPGYVADCLCLGDTFTELGFDVMIPSQHESHHLTAEEINSAVASFVKSLSPADECAGLFILTHGGDGFVYGSDGQKVLLAPLLQTLDNVNCIQMAGKPKMIVIQACRGDSLDQGVYKRVAQDHEQVVPAAETRQEHHLPVMSDTIICYPTMPGYVSLVVNGGLSQGSFLARSINTVFQEHAHEADIFSLLTMVNKKVADKVVSYSRSSSQDLAQHKQMPNFTSNLRRLFYFFPNPDGKYGKDWVL